MRKQMFQWLWVGQYQLLYQKIAQNMQQQSLKVVATEEEKEIPSDSIPVEETVEITTSKEEESELCTQ